ncbi:MAG: hypothetical protein RL757_2455 [Bacteroidota bacterium]|jgi:hypothetical protein
MDRSKFLIVVNYDRLPQGDLLKTGKKMLGNMPNEPSFAACMEFVKDYEVASQEFEVVDIKAKSRSNQDIANRKKFIDERMRPLLNKIAERAAPIIDQNHSLAILSGLLLRDEAESQRRKAGETEYKPYSVFYDFLANTITFSCLRVEGARGYEHIARPYDSDKWGEGVVSVTPTIVMKNMTMGIRYAIKVRTLNSRGEASDWSETFIL